MITTILAASLVAGAYQVSDFFPLVPGTRQTYEESGMQRIITVDEVLLPVEMKGSEVTPVRTMQDGKEIRTTFYQRVPNGVDVVAYDIKTPLKIPVPVLRITDAKKTEWTFRGPTSAAEFAEPVELKGSARMVGDRQVLNRKVPVLEVKITATVGGGKAKDRIEQTSYYGLGIGLVESISKTTVVKNVVTSTLRLVKMETVKPSVPVDGGKGDSGSKSGSGEAG